MTRTRTRRIVVSSAIVLALAGAFVAGRFASREPAPRADPAVERAPFLRKNADVPTWAPTAGWVLPEVGSVFRGRLATADSPLDGVEAVLVTPRAEECLDDCPLGLRMIGGDVGAKLIAKIPLTLGPDVRRLADAPGMPASVGDRLRRAHAELVQDVAAGRGDGSRPPTRALFIGMPRPDVAAGAWSIGVVVDDLVDPHFDPPRPGDSPREGRSLFITRVEALDAHGKPRIVVGAVAVGRSVGRLSRPIPANARELGTAFGSLWGHFGAVPDDMVGIYIDPEGRLLGFSSDLTLHALPESPVLRGALLALLRRA